MVLEPGCPRCPAAVTARGSSYTCPTHDEIVPLWRAAESQYDAFVEHLARSGPLPSLVPWPLPVGWHVTDFGCVAEEGGPAQATFVSCSGSSDLDGQVELTVLTEEPGVGLASRCGNTTFTDPGPEAGQAAPQTRVRLDTTAVPMWLVSTRDGDALDRCVLAGEAHGRWLWLVLRPASALLLLQEMGALTDLSTLGPELVTVPFGPAPRTW